MGATATADTHAATPNRLGHIAALDGVRALAVLAVIAFHLEAGIFVGGWVGVDIFFVLSGWLITTILLTEQSRRGTIGLPAFYMRRFLRLMPALVVSVALAAVVAATARSVANADHSGWDELSALTYTFDFRIELIRTGSILGPTWSLAVEEQFYLLWPIALVLWLRRGHRPITLAAPAAVGAVALCVIVTAVWGTRWVGFTPIGHAAELLIGVCAAVVRPRVPGWVAVLALGAAAVIAITVQDGSRWLYLGGLAALAIPLAGLVQHLATSPDRPIPRLLSWSPLVWIGQRSYGLYLYHLPVAYIADVHLGHGFRKPFTVVVAFLVAALSYRFIEQPFLRLKDRRFSSSRSATPADTAARVESAT